MRSFSSICELNDEDTRLVSRGIVEFNGAQMPYTQDPIFIQMSYGIKDDRGAVVAGVRATLYGWNCLSIEVLWTAETARGEGLGSTLLERVETEAKRRGAKLAHLDTFGFQARRFYEKRGYEVFGVLEDCPPGSSRIYMRKLLR